MKNLNKTLSLLVCAFALSIAGLQPAFAQGNSDNAPGKNKNLGHGNASNGVKAIIQANRQIFYTGDLLDIDVRFPRGAELISSGEVDAYLMIFGPDAVLQAVSISDLADTEPANLFQIDVVDVAFLPEGLYQLGVVLTVPEGNPLDISDWYNGMLGLVAVRGLTVSDTALEIDDDNDGFIDDEQDTDDDGFVDDDDTDDSSDASDDDMSDDGMA
ncbi:MAG: hypothetical protein VYE29_09935 [Pseudomonadota bacterium]|nr:hypothetical protein [Pseudomonadota bacterium]